MFYVLCVGDSVRVQNRRFMHVSYYEVKTYVQKASELKSSSYWNSVTMGQGRNGAGRGAIMLEYGTVRMVTVSALPLTQKLAYSYKLCCGGIIAKLRYYFYM